VSVEDELTNRRPSALSPLFRHHSLSASKGGSGRLHQWTRHVDNDWRWYCPHCHQVVLLIEEKLESAKEKSWAVTRRAATHHDDRPFAWLAIVHPDGTFTVTWARATEDTHDSGGPRRVDAETLIRWVERIFERHYDEQHPLVARAAA
jgi:hypothetical protein